MALTTCGDITLQPLSLVEIDFCKSEPDITFNPSCDESGIETDQTASPGSHTSSDESMKIDPYNTQWQIFTGSSPN
jgi:hypothetical protein